MRKLFLIIISLLTIGFARSQEMPEKKRPKIGLVLSGGGAKGFAHIGVLRVLEEAGIKIDYIGGTSMGAVIGGLYASGYNATQIDSIFRKTDFDELLTDFVPRSSKSFYEKRNDEQYAFTLPYKKFRIGIPMALSRGTYNYNLLARLTHNVRHIRDFNQLPIPFLCMATDIEKGESVLLNKGSLAQALLASSAFPSLFAPVELDGRFLIDGGVLNNYPIEEVKNMGADIIIGVDVQDNLKNKEALNSATKILTQISNIQMNENTKQKVAATDIYIKPNLKGFGVISFEEGEEIIHRGEEAAFAVYEKLKALGDKQNYKLPVQKTSEKDSLYIGNVKINHLDNYTQAFVIGKLGFKPGKTITYEKLNEGIDNLSATQNFSSILYHFDPNDGKDDMALELVENPIRNFIKFGLHYDDVYKSGVLVNLTHKKTILKNDVASIDIILGDNFRYNLDYYIDNGFSWSYGLRSRFYEFNKNVSTDFKNGTLLNQLGLSSINVDYSDFSNQLYLQNTFIQKFLMGGGLEYKYLKITSNTTEAVNPTIENSDYLSAFGYVKFDSFDNKYFPKKGWLFMGDFQSYLYSTNYSALFNPYSIAKGEIAYATSFFKERLSFKVNSETGFPVGPKSVPFFNFILGGYGYMPVNNFKHFFGYEFASLSGNSFIKSAFVLDYEFYRKHHLNFIANYANVEDDLFKGSEWFLKAKYKGYAVGYGLETIIGPIELKYTWSPNEPKGMTWITVGFWF